MKDLTLIILGNIIQKKEEKNLEMIYTDGKKILDDIKNAKGKFIAFIKEDDKITKDYLEKILEKSKRDFDCCYINHNLEFKYKENIKINTNSYELSRNKPYYGEYLWSFIFKKEKLLTVLEIKQKEEFNSTVDKIFEKTAALGNIIYFHNPSGKKFIENIQYNDIKKEEYYKNIIYVGDGCNGMFNGYISWINNLGRCFKDKYNITLLYDNIHPQTYANFSKHIHCVKRENDVNYTCDRLLVTYSTYFYPKNITALEKNYLFIHGNMSDYKSSRVFHDDIYSHYVAVSKIAAEKAEGYFPTTNIEYVTNPFILDKELVKPHLKLTSAFRYSDIKRPERVEKMAELLEKMKIPYTWNLFTDKYEGTNVNGLIYRKRTDNPLPYIEDSDYFVLLSDSEAMPYCILEALAVNTKVVVTPLEAYDELDIRNNENAIIIPFEYFEKENEDKLIEVIEKMYKEKNKKINYKINEALWQGYNDIFTK